MKPNFEMPKVKDGYSLSLLQKNVEFVQHYYGAGNNQYPHNYSKLLDDEIAFLTMPLTLFEHFGGGNCSSIFFSVKIG